MKYLSSKPFSGGANSKAFVENWDAIFGKGNVKSSGENHDFDHSRDVGEMSDEDIEHELLSLRVAFGQRGDHGGSPGEWITERMDELETAMSRRFPGRE
jgi:hypothetical protein